MPVVTINGQRVEAAAGASILDVARKAGYYVPSLCWHVKTGRTAACRICAVEVEGARGLVMACNADVADGMVIRTETAQVLEARRMIVELLLADGDHDCLVCEASGKCELQDAAYRLGILRPPYRLEKPALPVDDSHPMFLRNPNKCIGRYRCIKGCNQVVVNEVLDMAYRGTRSLVIADQLAAMGSSSCVACGECVQMCPTGALIERKASRKGRSWDLEQVRTTCPYCGVGCQVVLHVDQAVNRVVKVTGADAVPPNDGMLCVKGRFGYDFPASPRRLTDPLIRKDGELVPVSWDEALDFTAKRLSEIKAAHGADAISLISSSRDMNENSYAGQKFARAVLGTNNVDNCART